MFRTLGLFADVPCPQGQTCSLLTCLFSHKARNLPTATSQPHRPTSILGDDTARPSKRLKVEADPSALTEVSGASHKAETTTTSPESMLPTFRKEAHMDKGTPKLTSALRSVSPPPPKRPLSRSSGTKDTNAITSASQKPASMQLPPRKVPMETLNPRMLPKAPASHPIRTAILKKLHAAMVGLNERLVKEKDSKNGVFILNKDELITMALDEEERVAKENPGVYSNIIKNRIVKLPKSSTEEWVKEVMAHLNMRYYHLNPIQLVQARAQEAPKLIVTGLTTKEEVALVPELLTPLEGLEQFGYVTKAPTDGEIEIAKKGAEGSKGWEKCDRCSGRFQVFPGRREDGALASGGQCTYHPSRPIFPPRKRTDNVTGSSESYFPCCGESVGTSVGCTKGNTHVFKVSETKRLASILQFQETPRQPNKGPLDPVCFDCEMGYTTIGMELIRLTAVSWPEGRELLDVLVKPMGEVLDLNSRYSGVFQEHYSIATPYGKPAPPKEEGKQQPLQMVESPTAARDLLFKLLQPETPLMGHAIDNDLNVCRVIHPTIIDTVLLYPAPRRLPNRLSLKFLARKFLEREIQTGGDKGHDSKEDSIATGDLVRVKVGELWKRLKAKGWKFEGDALIAPPGQASKGMHKVVLDLEYGLGQKRKDPSA
ncbi:NAD(+) kinase [Penicillium atrosanguineum]|uniref:NAD(+) kinase n=1 Tax=Penicillium atrosanguineum TaxID=1132637 RepID=UPI00238844ED|nr:NAD(+) kinase [Penicillium atrosanguineum]KAJ5290103.1 NAD(+) kinase [Penicillium atrosanguineum]